MKTNPDHIYCGQRKPGEPRDSSGEAEIGVLARLQGPKARKAMDAAFHASPQQLGQAALKAKKRGHQ